MKKKYVNGDFGYCPRALCEEQKVLPVAMVEIIRFSRVKVYCPKCEEVYVPSKGQVEIDGAYFGKSFPLVFFNTYPSLIPKEKQALYFPKIFGFKIYGNKGSKYEIKKKYRDTF